MVERKLSVDLSSLWINPEGKFIIRFLDINENSKRIFTKRIKETAPYRTIKKASGPPIQNIYDVLMEINPIIFSEGTNARRGNFNCYAIRTIGGWHFRDLCKAIYVTTVLKRNPTAREMERIAYQSTNDWGKARTLIERQMLSTTREEEQRIAPITDIGIEDIAYATRAAVNSGANNIPNEIFGYDNAIEIADNIMNAGAIGPIDPLTARRNIERIAASHQPINNQYYRVNPNQFVGIDPFRSDPRQEPIQTLTSREINDITARLMRDEPSPNENSN